MGALRIISDTFVPKDIRLHYTKRVWQVNIPATPWPRRSVAKRVRSKSLKLAPALERQILQGRDIKRISLDLLYIARHLQITQASRSESGPLHHSDVDAGREGRVDQRAAGLESTRAENSQAHRQVHRAQPRTAPEGPGSDAPQLARLRKRHVPQVAAAVVRVVGDLLHVDAHREQPLCTDVCIAVLCDGFLFEASVFVLVHSLTGRLRSRMVRRLGKRE